jgi:ubiquinone/menaquinone biosynthesis C-methylase UbiE
MDQKILSDFDIHWRKHAAREISLPKKAKARDFLRLVLERMERCAEPLRILDMGCGDGVHAVVLAEADLGEHCYYGIDISTEAVKLAQGRIYSIDQAKAKFQIGNAVSLPYRSDSFDVVFSYGVIAYTGAPQKALDEMMRVCKPGGLIGVWVYPKIDGTAGALFDFTRAVCHHLGRRFSKIIVNIVVPLLPILPVHSGINPFNATWQQCVEVVEVNLLPEVLEFYTLQDVLEWFSRRRMKIQSVDPREPISVWARTCEQ